MQTALDSNSTCADMHAYLMAQYSTRTGTDKRMIGDLCAAITKSCARIAADPATIPCMRLLDANGWKLRRAGAGDVAITHLKGIFTEHGISFIESLSLQSSLMDLANAMLEDMPLEKLKTTAGHALYNHLKTQDGITFRKATYKTIGELIADESNAKQALQIIPTMGTLRATYVFDFLKQHGITAEHGTER